MTLLYHSLSLIQSGENWILLVSCKRRAGFHFFGLNYLPSFVSFLFPEIVPRGTIGLFPDDAVLRGTLFAGLNGKIEHLSSAAKTAGFCRLQRIVRLFHWDVLISFQIVAQEENTGK